MEVQICRHCSQDMEIIRMDPGVLYVFTLPDGSPAQAARFAAHLIERAKEVPEAMRPIIVVVYGGFDIARFPEEVA